MSIIIDNGNKKVISQKKKYSKLIVETSIVAENDSKIVVGLNQKVNKKDDFSRKGGQAQNSVEFKINELPVKNNNIEIRNLVDTTKSIKVGKGQKISLSKNCSDISKLIVTFDYNIISDDHFEFDLDASVFMVDIDDKTAEQDFIFYENTTSTCGGVTIKKDHNTGIKEAYDDCIQLDLSKIPSNIQKLAFTITIYEANERKQSFKKVSDGHLRIIASDTKQEILSYKFNENLSIETALVVAEIYRYKNEWKINCIGSGFRGGLESLCNNYGIETD